MICMQPESSGFDLGRCWHLSKAELPSGPGVLGGQVSQMQGGPLVGGA